MFSRTFKRRLCQSTALVACTFLSAQVLAPRVASADDFFIETPTTITNGGNILNGNDSLTITESGSITTAGAAAVTATGSTNIIRNYGSVFTTGVFADAIAVTNNSMVVNSGSISTTGGAAFGFYANNFNTLTNSGSITTTGVGSYAISAYRNNVITNSGSITTSGGFGHGVIAYNDNVISNSGSITTSGFAAYGIYANSSNTISNSGAIITRGNASYGISANDNNTVTVSGSIATSGIVADGIYVDDFNRVTTSGSITTTGNGSDAIQVDDNNVVTNTGSLTTTGISSYGIYADDDNVIVNSGSISTFGNGGYGIYADNRNTIANTGSIITRGNFADGIDVSNNNTVTNSGSIRTFGTSSDGIDSNDNNTITNTGFLFATGPNSEGIDAEDNNIITNSGSVVSAQGSSFELSNNNTLNLLAPSFIGGPIDLGTNTSLNIVTGLSHSVLWDFSTGTMAGGAPSITGSIPFFYNAATMQFATFDPTTFTASIDALAEMTGLLTNLIQMRLEGKLTNALLGSGNNGLNAYAATREASSETNPVSDEIALAFDRAAGASAPTAPRKAWVSVLGSGSDYDGNNTTHDFNLNHWGVASGYEWSPSVDVQFGVLGGYIESVVDADSRFANTYKNESSGLFAGFYGRKEAETHFVDFALMGGVSEQSDERFVNDNLSPLGVSHATGEYNGIWFSPQIAIGKHYALHSDWIASPTARLRYAAQWLDGYSETGARANAIVGSRHVAIGEAALEFAATRNTGTSITTVRVGYLYRTSFGDKSTGVTLIGQTVSIPTFDEDRHAAYVGGNTSIAITDSLNLALGGQIMLSQDFTGIGGNIRLVSKF